MSHFYSRVWFWLVSSLLPESGNDFAKTSAWPILCYKRVIMEKLMYLLATIKNGSTVRTVIGLVLFIFFITSAVAQTNITPAQYLASLPKPVFKPGHRLPHLSKFSWPYPVTLREEMAANWGYALEFGGYNELINGGLEKALANTNSDNYKMLWLATNYPGKFKLQVDLDRSWPTNLSNGFWVTNAEGLFVDNKTNTWQYRTNQNYTPIVSPEAPLVDLQIQASNIVAPLLTLNAMAPIAIVINGGERDLGVVGFDQKSWQFDPRIRATGVFTNKWDYFTNKSGLSWPRYISSQKARHMKVLTDLVKAAVPGRDFYVWYHSGTEQSRFNQPGYDWENEWARWGWISDVLNPSLDIPSFESYYTGPNSFTNATGTRWNNVTDLLTKHLNAVGYNIARGYPTNYSFVCGGWSNNNTNRLADLARYTGFLKCLYTSGTIGANAGYYEFPISQTNSYLFGGPGFNASFPSNQPPHWLLQIVALSRVHALFSHLENYLYNGYLLAGDGQHVMSLDQPSYEFTNTLSDPTARVLVRKLNASNDWLITAWAAAGDDRNVTVTLPQLGQLELRATASGSVYRATATSVTLLDESRLGAIPATPTGLQAVTPRSAK
ncbi:MAG TPA: hypothetical protein P5186_06330 [Candidatus Paceibacterota bacterium]|nr:hypothetical protein [Candidatus Paceibacterota bacterium]